MGAFDLVVTQLQYDDYYDINAWLSHKPPQTFSIDIFFFFSMNGNDFSVLLGIGSRVLSQDIIDISLLD